MPNEHAPRVAKQHRVPADDLAAFEAFLEDSDFDGPDPEDQDASEANLDEDVPVFPPTVTVTPWQSGYVKVKWPKVALATGYKVYRGTSPNPTSLRVTVGDVGFTIDAVSADTFYYYRIKATNADGDSAYSDNASIETST